MSPAPLKLYHLLLQSTNEDSVAVVSTKSHLPIPQGPKTTNSFIHSSNVKPLYGSYETEDVHLTVKLFWNEQAGQTHGHANLVPEIISALQQRLEGITTKECIDTLIIDAAETSDLHSLWPVLEANVKQGQVGRLGVANFDESSLKALLGAAEISPVLNQLPSNGCCLKQVDKALVETCHQSKVKLVNNPDPSTRALFLQCQEVHWECQPNFAVRYVVTIPGRGLVIDQGDLWWMVCL